MPNELGTYVCVQKHFTKEKNMTTDGKHFQLLGTNTSALSRVLSVFKSLLRVLFVRRMGTRGGGGWQGMGGVYQEFLVRKLATPPLVKLYVNL